MAFNVFGGYQSYPDSGNSRTRLVEIVMKSGFSFEIHCDDYTIMKDSMGKIAKIELQPAKGEDSVAYIDPKEIALVVIKH